MNLAFAKEWLDALDGDLGLDRVMEMYADDAVVGMVSGKIFSGDKAKVREVFANFCNIHPEKGSWRFEPLAYYGDEHAGVIPFTWRGKTGADFLGVPVEPGTAVDSVCVSVHEYKNGKILKEDSYWDPITIFKQLGVWQTFVESVPKR